jgi:hypothetical protein
VSGRTGWGDSPAFPRIERASGASLRTIDTVVDENPLSFATSRIVTIEALPLNCGTQFAKTYAEIWSTAIES